MKGYLLITVLVCCSYVSNVKATAYGDKRKQVYSQCKRELEMDDKTYKEMTEDFKVPTTKNEKCFMDCYANKMGFMSDVEIKLNSVLLANKLIWTDPSQLQVADELTMECYKEVGTKMTKCETAGQFFGCFRKGSKERNLKMNTEE